MFAATWGNDYKFYLAQKLLSKRVSIQILEVKYNSVTVSEFLHQLREGKFWGLSTIAR